MPKPLLKKIVAGIFFAILALALSTVTPSIEIAWVTAFLVLTIYLFAFEVVGVDVAAISILVLLGVSSLLAPLMGLSAGLVDNQHIFDGFSSNAVMSIIAVMINPLIEIIILAFISANPVRSSWVRYAFR